MKHTASELQAGSDKVDRQLLGTGFRGLAPARGQRCTVCNELWAEHTIDEWQSGCKRLESPLKQGMVGA